MGFVQGSGVAMLCLVSVVAWCIGCVSVYKDTMVTTWPLAPGNLPHRVKAADPGSAVNNTTIQRSLPTQRTTNLNTSMCMERVLPQITAPGVLVAHYTWFK